jgi:hypothetical protein
MSGLKFNAHFARTSNAPVDALFYQPLGTGGTGNAPTADPSKWVSRIRTSEFKVGFTFEPGATYVNTKQRRLKINHDAPVFTVSHTFGLDNFLGGQYDYNVTEAGVYKRLWLGSWGKIDIDAKAGIQWNIVPFPLLIHPAANQSYILEDHTFSLISNL